jgi:lysophospholipase L1-like esterase
MLFLYAIIYTFIGIFVLVFVVYQYLVRKLRFHRPKNFPRQGQVPYSAAKGKKSVVCIGDSITHGNVSANYVDMLERWMGEDFFFYNAGVNSDLTYTVLDRLDAIIAAQPDFVTLLIGTNDVNATVSKASLRKYYQFKKITPGSIPDFESFQKNYVEIVRRLKTETKATIAVISLPVMGEDLQNEANLKADLYSEFIKQLAGKEQVTYLPVRERMKDFLKSHPKKLKYEYKDTIKLMYLSVSKHELLGQNWDTICLAHGMDLTQDNLHFNTRGAAMIASLAEKFLSPSSTGH